MDIFSSKLGLFFLFLLVKPYVLDSQKNYLIKRFLLSFTNVLVEK